jgi:hypothetical protein
MGNLVAIAPRAAFGSTYPASQSFWQIRKSASDLHQSDTNLRGSLAPDAPRRVTSLEIEMYDLNARSHFSSLLVTPITEIRNAYSERKPAARSKIPSSLLLIWPPNFDKSVGQPTHRRLGPEGNSS